MLKIRDRTPLNEEKIKITEHYQLAKGRISQWLHNYKTSTDSALICASSQIAALAFHF